MCNVTPTTRLYGPDGSPIQLDQVPTIADSGIGVRYPRRARVDFRAVQQRGRHYLTRLWVRSR